MVQLLFLPQLFPRREQYFSALSYSAATCPRDEKNCLPVLAACFALPCRECLHPPRQWAELRRQLAGVASTCVLPISHQQRRLLVKGYPEGISQAASSPSTHRRCVFTLDTHRFQLLPLPDWLLRCSALFTRANAAKVVQRTFVPWTLL